MPFVLESTLLPELGADERGIRECSACPPYVVRCAHDPAPEHEGRVVWLIDTSRGLDPHENDGRYEVLEGHPGIPELGEAISDRCSCNFIRATSLSTTYEWFPIRQEADEAFERFERIMLGREVE